MEDEEGYENITVFSGLQQYAALDKKKSGVELTLYRWLLPDVRKLQNRLRTSSTTEGDLMSALVVAIQQIDTATTGKTGNPLKFKRRIVVVTDGRGAMDTGDLEHIQNKIKDASAPIQLTLLLVIH